MKHPPRSINNATTWALSVFDSDLSTTQKLICLYLRTHMNDYRECAWPSVGRIADRCSLGERAVYKNLKQICESGYLMRNGVSDSGTVRYAICTPALDAPLHLNTDTPAPDAPELTKELTNNIYKGKFKKPTLEEVTAYCQERGNKVDPERFIDHYQSNGWKVGRNAMKDWKAAIRTWEKNNEKAKQHNEQSRKLSAVERVRAKREEARIRQQQPYMGAVVDIN